MRYKTLISNSQLRGREYGLTKAVQQKVFFIKLPSSSPSRALSPLGCPMISQRVFVPSSQSSIELDQPAIAGWVPILCSEYRLALCSFSLHTAHPLA